MGTVLAALLESRKARSPDFHQHLNKPSKLGNAGRISGQVAPPGEESGKTVFHETFQTLQGRSAHADTGLGTDLSSPASAGISGFWKQRGTRYATLRQLSGHRLLPAAGSSTATPCPFGTHARLRKQRDTQYATLGQLSGLRFLAAAGSSAAAARPFGPHPGLGSKRHGSHTAKRPHARNRHIPGPCALGIFRNNVAASMRQSSRRDDSTVAGGKTAAAPPPVLFSSETDPGRGRSVM